MRTSILQAVESAAQIGRLLLDSPFQETLILFVFEDKLAAFQRIEDLV
jgi:hypothetical protein